MMTSAAHAKGANKVDAAYGRLKEVAVNFTLRPGSHLDLNEVSDWLGVSPTPTREALARLLSEFLVSFVPNQGFFMREIDRGELRDLFHLADLVLKDCLASGLPPGEGLDDVEAAVDAEATAVGLEALYLRVAVSSCNREAVRIIRNFNDRTRYIRQIDAGGPRAEAFAGEVADLSQALARGDARRLAARLEAGFAATLARLPRLVEEGMLRAYAAPGSLAHTPAARREPLPPQAVGL